MDRYIDLFFICIFDENVHVKIFDECTLVTSSSVFINLSFQ